MNHNLTNIIGKSDILLFNDRVKWFNSDVNLLQPHQDIKAITAFVLHAPKVKLQSLKL
jgi:hypothetical protein